MSDVLAAARRLMGDECFQPEGPRSRCIYCNEFCWSDPHLPDCPWLQLPQIVAALEAAERVREAWLGSVDDFPVFEILERVKIMSAALAAGSRPVSDQP